MDHVRSISRVLHQDHLETIALLNRLENGLLRGRPGALPDVSNLEVAKLLRDIAASASAEVSGHFAFEENQLFPRLEAMGDASIGELLAEEHAILLPIAARLAELAGLAGQGGASAEDWAEFRRLGGEYVERMISHIQKEEMGLLPVLDDVIDEDEDMELTSLYAASR